MSECGAINVMLRSIIYSQTVDVESVLIVLRKKYRGNNALIENMCHAKMA